MYAAKLYPDLFGRTTIKAGENHSASSSLQHFGHCYRCLGVYMTFSIFNDNHRAIVQVGNPLAGFTTLLDDVYRQPFARE